jgi:hypothetical protein
MVTTKIEVIHKELYDSIIHSLVDTKAVTKRSWRIVLTMVFAMVVMNAGALAWFYTKYNHPHVRYIKSVEGKTFIGLTDAESIDANPDRQYGGSLIEVVHRAKK